jgi:hypothetical protein
MVKFTQGIFINRDPKMTTKIPKGEDILAHCNSSNLNEELG